MSRINTRNDEHMARMKNFLAFHGLRSGFAPDLLADLLKLTLTAKPIQAGAAAAALPPSFQRRPCTPPAQTVQALPPF
ncbi:hypothetical protein [Kerstersia gyiorum]|uniref:hypothetical protein n=1 Tax=Kerstersia gyiorum TaxID=206506 RepID=UPI001249151D|nr:hypothetical protein [Kerstersia gyiorum]KAB0541988.1 hypothetical protein F7P85_15975 [Kerstersia gyiorum]MCP1632558.1 hypothetical protein [Kerstersia gyiorum]MCP1708041.1 hypothetical protein [Kerstersia gyiorum]MCR4160470.1 hypothetical protein [Kerstersia gyiorum]